MQSGILLLDKTTGVSSAQALNMLKRKLKLKKLGHCGTLDPMASGLLVCLLGTATRLARFAEQGAKIYSGTIQFGIQTDTDDITGKVISSSDQVVDFSEIERRVAELVGEIDQVPPAYSALKREGRRAYELAREGIAPELAARKVSVRHFQIEPLSQNLIFFRLHCSKGTYVRSLARDLGTSLGCGATLASLRREGSSPFSVVQAKELDHISESDILGVEALFPDTPTLKLETSLARRLVCGQQEALREIDQNLSCESMLYCDRQNEVPLGLLVRSSSGWEIGVNL